MLNIQNMKPILSLPPLDINGTTATITEIDTRPVGTSGVAPAGPFHYMTIIFSLGNIAANMTALKLQGGDVTGTLSDITGGAHTAPLAATGDNQFWVWNVDLRKNGYRFYNVVATAGAGATLASMVTILSRSEAPVAQTAAGTGAFGFINI